VNAISKIAAGVNNNHPYTCRMPGLLDRMKRNFCGMGVDGPSNVGPSIEINDKNAVIDQP